MITLKIEHGHGPSLTLGRSSLHRRLNVFSTQSFEERADAMAELLAPHHAHVGHPIELNHPARAFKGVKAMPGIGIIAEDQQGAFIGRHFRDHIDRKSVV